MADKKSTDVREKSSNPREQNNIHRKGRFDKKEKSWILYDWANSVFATNIMAAIFPIYFATVATSDGNKLFGYVISASTLVVAILAPLLGAIADYKGMKKKLFTGFLIVGLVFTALMALTDSWGMMLVGYGLALIGYNGSILFYDSFLTDVTTKDKMHKVSAWGYAMGYIGGSTIPFVASIIIMQLMGQSALSVKIAIIITVVWWAIFSIPFMLNVKQTYYLDKPKSKIKDTFGNIKITIQYIIKKRALLLFIIAFFFYIDGVHSIISLATNYGTILGLNAMGLILALLVTQLIGVPFSILFGRLAKKIGSIRMITIAVAVYFVITLVGFVMGQTIESAQTDLDNRIVTALDNYKSKAPSAQTAEFKALVYGDENNEEDNLVVLFKKAVLPSDKEKTELEKTYKDKTPEQIYGAEVQKFCDKHKDYFVDLQLVSVQLVPVLKDVDHFKDARSLAQLMFWILAALVGTVQGGIQAISRSFFGKLIPKERSSEFFGFFDIFGKFAAVIGPLLYAFFLGATGKASFAILSFLILFALGMIVLFIGRKQFALAESQISPADESSPEPNNVDAAPAQEE